MIYSVNSSLYTSLPNTAVTNGEYLFWFPYWQMIRDCIMGEILVKARKTQYLPKMESQSDDEYNAFLTRATFYNATARTLNGLVGAVHSRAPIIDGLPDSIDLSVVTNDGQSFDMFVKKITKEVIALGRYGIMIDAPPQSGDPYFVGYDAEDIVDWATVRVGSREKLFYVVLREVSEVRLPFGPKAAEPAETYRVLFIDSDGFYKQRVYPTGNLGSEDYAEYVPLMQGRPMTEIPFLMVGPYDFGYNIEKPPMLDIALLNLSHYRSYAQLEAGRFYTATPIYTVAFSGGGDEDTEFKIGPNTVWQLGGDDKATILEFSGAGLKYLENAIIMKEQQIAALGGKMATATAGTAAESTDSVLARERGEANFLGSVIETISEAASRLLSALAAWHGSSADVSVSYASDATEINLDARQIRAMSQLYETGLMPMETIFMVFRRNNIIPQGVSFEEFKAMLPQKTPKVANALVLDEGKVEHQIELETEKAKLAKKYAPEPAPVAPKPPVTAKKPGLPPKKA